MEDGNFTELNRIFKGFNNSAPGTAKGVYDLCSQGGTCPDFKAQIQKEMAESELNGGIWLVMIKSPYNTSSGYHVFTVVAKDGVAYKCNFNRTWIKNLEEVESKEAIVINVSRELYDEIINQIIDLMLDYDSFNKEASILQEKIIKYRSSNILQLCFKIYWQRLHTCMQYMVKKYILFLYNEKLFKTTSKILPTLIKILIDDIYDRILNGISKNNIFLKHKGNYQKKIQFYREFCYMFFIFQSFDKDSEKEIFNIKEDIDLDDSENLFDDVERFKYHILNRTGLNISLEFFKERVNIDDVYESYFKKILLLYQQYKSFLPYYKRCGFLYG